MGLTLITDDRFEDHRTPPGHPECPERAQVMQVVAEAWTAGGGEVGRPRPATIAELARVHTKEYLEAIAALSGRSAALDPDTFTSPDSYEVARLAAGAAIAAVDLAIGSGASRRAISLVRPPGHHAEAGRAMGFCLFNNVAVAAAHALDAGIERVAIIDYDVHHGNGTQWMFFQDPRVLYVSTHQYPYYPGTGAAGELGSGPGEGFTLNVPLDVGATDADYAFVMKRLIEPVVRQFSPGLLLVSAGFDAHERDPLAGMRMSTNGYGWLNAELGRLADRVCEGRMALVTEGGYDFKALGECLMGAARVLDGSDAAAVTEPSGDTMRGSAAVQAVTTVHRRYWQL